MPYRGFLPKGQCVATASNYRSVHGTLVSTGVDTVTISGVWDRIRITNRETLFGRPMWAIGGSDTTLTAGLNGSYYIPAGCSIEIDYGNGGVVQLVGDRNAYSVEGVTTLVDSRGL